MVNALEAERGAFLMPCPNDHRKRLVTVGFRVTAEQSQRINDLVALSGMTKQDYIVKRLECEEIIAKPSSRLYKALRDDVRLVYRELARLVDGGCPDERIVKLAESLAVVFTAEGSDENDACASAYSSLVANMSRR